MTKPPRPREEVVAEAEEVLYLIDDTPALAQDDHFYWSVFPDLHRLLGELVSCAGVLRRTDSWP